MRRHVPRLMYILLCFKKFLPSRNLFWGFVCDAIVCKFNGRLFQKVKPMQGCQTSFNGGPVTIFSSNWRPSLFTTLGFLLFRSSASRQVQMSNDSTLLHVVVFSLGFPYPSSNIQSISFCLGLPLPLHSSLHYLSM